jgi:hypothetical protein
VSVYVDEMLIGATVPFGARVIRGQWSRLLADSSLELMLFADRLGGLRREWLREAGTPSEHYEVTPSTRRRAVVLGAVPISLHEASLLIRAKRSGTRFDLSVVRGNAPWIEHP